MKKKIIKNQHFFITGTDTEVGKTYVTRLLAEYYRDQNHNVALFKPIASGCEEENNPLTNEDVASYVSFDPRISSDLINIWHYGPAIAPHIAASKLGKPLTLAIFAKEMGRLLERRGYAFPYDIGLIEGAGGWKLPLNDHETLDQWVVENDIPIILVVGMKLGCINHALLTVSAIQSAGAKLAGWIANVSSPMPYLNENLKTLEKSISAPCMGIVNPHQTTLELEI